MITEGHCGQFWKGRGSGHQIEWIAQWPGQGLYFLQGHCSIYRHNHVIST